jgi:hypothetical protein
MARILMWQLTFRHIIYQGLHQKKDGAAVANPVKARNMAIVIVILQIMANVTYLAIFME